MLFVFFSLVKNAVYGKNCRIEQIPSDKILIETDAIADIVLIDIVNEISKTKNESNMADIIYDNAQRVLKHE